MRSVCPVKDIAIVIFLSDPIYFQLKPPKKIE